MTLKIQFGFLLSLCLLFFCTVKPAASMDLYSYDLDSLAYMSSEIVEGDLVRTYVGPTGIDLVDVKINAVYKGKFAAGQTVTVTATDFFRKEPTDLFRSKLLDQGDHLFLFLVRAKSVFLYNIPNDAEIYWPVPSGIKLVQQNQVLSFQQYSNPGPYVADSPATNPQASFPRLEFFRGQLRHSIVEAEIVRPLLVSSSKMADIPRLVALIHAREHSQPTMFGRDEVAETACKKLADLHIYTVLATLLSENLGWGMESIIGGFGTPTGRDYLLRQVENRNNTHAQRLRFAEIVGAAGGVYYAQTDTPFFSKKMQPKSEPINGGYYGRIAALALASRKDTELCGVLITMLKGFAESIENTSESGMDEKRAGKEDLRNAAPLLNALYKATDSEEIKYKIEYILWFASPEAFRALHAPGGSVLSMLTLTSKSIYPTGKGREVVYDYEGRLLTGSTKGVISLLALLNLATQKEYLLPTADVGLGRGGNNIILPRDMPAGSYRIRLKFYRMGKSIGNSHFSDATL